MSLRRRVRDGRYITGPLGIWPWPILNVILIFMQRVREIRYGHTYSAQRQESKKKAHMYEFVRDKEGRIIQIVEWEA